MPTDMAPHKLTNELKMFGIPDEMFYFPEHFGFQKCVKKVESNVLSWITQRDNHHKALQKILTNIWSITSWDSQCLRVIEMKQEKSTTLLFQHQLSFYCRLRSFTRYLLNLSQYRVVTQPSQNNIFRNDY